MLLGQTGEIFKGKGISKDEILSEGLPCVRYAEIYTRYGIAIRDVFSFISLESAAQSLPIYKNDILFAGSGETAEEIGKNTVYLGNETAYAGGDTIILRPNKEVDALFLSYLFECEYVRQQKFINGQGHSVVHIYPSALQEIEVFIPPLPEQRRIAKILSTWDEAIDQQTKLIELKEKRKKALMQKLLSGEVRFPGFEGEWDTARLRDVAELIKDGTHGTHVEVSRGVPLLSAKDIFNGEIHIPGDCRKISSEDYGSIHSRYKPEGGDILLTVVGTIGRCALVHRETPQFTFQRSVAIVRIKKEYDFNFFYQLFTSDKFIHQLNLRSNASAQAGVYLGELEKMEVSFPLDTAEQKVIADILGACDLEMKHYKKKLTALIKQKQGIIQQLLTGQTRVYN